ncbi:MAG: NADH-quinone oxidoreductase subunit J [Proteobacteria bacterium]|nr:NADH-quinone oxidoreductase subunit J [Pseudomonadota bacterium]
MTPETTAPAATPIPSLAAASNTEAIGAVLYTDYAYLFQAAGLVLLVAMIGAIVLTHRTRSGVRKQRVGDQLARTREESVEIKQVSSGEGV